MKFSKYTISKVYRFSCTVILVLYSSYNQPFNYMCFQYNLPYILCPKCKSFKLYNKISNTVFYILFQCLVFSQYIIFLILSEIQFMYLISNFYLCHNPQHESCQLHIIKAVTWAFLILYNSTFQNEKQIDHSKFLLTLRQRNKNNYFLCNVWCVWNLILLKSFCVEKAILSGKLSGHFTVRSPKWVFPTY